MKCQQRLCQSGNCNVCEATNETLENRYEKVKKMKMDLMISTEEKPVKPVEKMLLVLSYSICTFLPYSSIKANMSYVDGSAVNI